MPWLINPAVWFVIMQLVMSLGTIPLIDSERESDIVYALSMSSVMFFFIMGTEVRRAVMNNPKKSSLNWSKVLVILEKNNRIDFLMSSIAITAIAVSFTYYHVIGYNVFLDGVKQIFSGDGIYEAWDARRLQMYAGAEYFAPGYVNQFKNILLPLICGYFICTGILLRQRKRTYWGILLAVFSFVFITGTGQRGPLVFALAMIFIFVMNTFKIGRGKMSIFIFAIAISGFAILTLLLGRSINEVSDTTDIFRLIWSFPERIFFDNQYCGIVGFNYIHTLPTSWGREWLDSLVSVLPNVRIHDTIASRIHAIIWGSDQGTAPLTLVGELWYNFHLFGVTIVAFILGYIYASVYWSLFTKTKDVFTLLIYSALAVILGSWSAGDVKTLLDQGLATVIIFYFMGYYFPKVTLYNTSKKNGT